MAGSHEYMYGCNTLKTYSSKINEVSKTINTTMWNTNFKQI